MTSGEGPTLREAVDWCGAGLTLREASRLRRMAAAENDPGKPLNDETAATADQAPSNRDNH